jgi:UDP-N-acetylmuramoylalanine--D-glutamate ligase
MMLAIKVKDTMRNSGSWSGKKVLVVGIARQGIALSRYLTRHGAQVLVNDRRSLDQLEDAREALAGEPIEWITGGHPLSALDGVDLVCISGGIPVDNPIVVGAREIGIPISNDSDIFLEVCPCPVVGITGSAGKTTTTTLVGLIAEAAVEQLEVRSEIDATGASGRALIDSNSKIWVGGNIGSPLITEVDRMQSNDLAVMELSSFQLEIMRSSPDVAAVLNITPNHLDRHGSMESYAAAKARIIEFQDREDVAVLNMDDPDVARLENDIKGKFVVFSRYPLEINAPSVYFDSKSQNVCIKVKPNLPVDGVKVINQLDIPLRGEHNLMNVIAACAVAVACRFPTSAMETGVKSFEGIPHRLEFVRSWGGGDWYNDSIATAPERSIAAIESFSEPLILLAGGRDKALPWDKFAALVCERVKHLILFGEAVGVISEALSGYEVDSEITVTICSGLREAVNAAAVKVSEGDVVLLSPGGTSFDEFHDFEERGEAFKKWVMELV